MGSPVAHGGSAGAVCLTGAASGLCSPRPPLQPPLATTPLPPKPGTPLQNTCVQLQRRTNKVIFNSEACYLHPVEQDTGAWCGKRNQSSSGSFFESFCSSETTYLDSGNLLSMA